MTFACAPKPSENGLPIRRVLTVHAEVQVLVVPWGAGTVVAVFRSMEQIADPVANLREFRRRPRPPGRRLRPPDRLLDKFGHH